MLDRVFGLTGCQAFLSTHDKRQACTLRPSNGDRKKLILLNDIFIKADTLHLFQSGW
jgi:hypothetical protein